MKKVLLCVVMSLIFVCSVSAQQEMDIASVMEKQRQELIEKEEILKKEKERLKLLKQEVEAGIAKYNEILKQIDKSLIKAEEIGNKRLRHVAKAYEAMQPEDAASRLTGLETSIAVQILLKMNSKKAGLVIGMMDPTKATLLTKDLAKMKR